MPDTIENTVPGAARKVLLTRPSRAGAARLALAAAALLLVALALAQPLLAASGHAPGWALWACSHSPSGSLRRFVPTGRLGAAFGLSRRALALHWPHLLPIPLALGTLLYLYRADRQARRRFSARAGRASVPARSARSASAALRAAS